MHLTEAALPVFARHQTFHPRYGWFRKAVTHAARDPQVFGAADANVQLGVGKNMVKSIRFWGLAAKLLTEEAGVVPTEFGRLMFSEDGGLDPFVELPATLWLLHWKLLSPKCELPVWWVAFNDFDAVEFTVDKLEEACEKRLAVAGSWRQPSNSSIRKDISALMRTYAPAERSKRNNLDDILDSPMRELGLISKSVATGNFRFTLGPKPTLPAAILAYAILDFVAIDNPQAKRVSLSRIAEETGTPGRAFKLGDSEILDALQEFVELQISEGLALSSQVGTSQLSWTTDPKQLSRELLRNYYREATSPNHQETASPNSQEATSPNAESDDDQAPPKTSGRQAPLKAVA